MENYISLLLNNNLFSDAIRLAEIHNAEINTEDSLYLLALSYFRGSKHNATYQILSTTRFNQPRTKLLFAQACLKVGKYYEAEKALACPPTKEHLVKSYGCDLTAAVAARYLGSILERTSRSTEAIEYFRASLELFPYLWGSAEALARLMDKNPTSFLSNALTRYRKHDDSSTTTATTTTLSSPQRESRRITRLYSIENSNQTPASRSHLSNPNAPSKKIRLMPLPEPGLDATAKVFLECFKAVDYLHQFKLDKAISTLKGLPKKHFNTGWVLTCIGRALYEKTNFSDSVKYYESARKLEPYRLNGMEYYSSALWQLQKEVELSVLAKELIEFDQEAPETWCVAGNCYSLQKEHESAIKYLEKAIKVDPNFAYAHTLLGHELISAERLDQAKTHFRAATRLDPRHWNAWCGLGCIYYKNELYTNSELYYMKALKIAPTNPVLMCQLAVVQHACKKTNAAIETLSKALQIDPDNALCRFHKATMYSALDDNEKALKELDELKRIVPKESMVYFLLGKIHKKTGNTHTALMNFSWAMELDPKGANNTIKDVIDKQHSGEDDVVVHRD